MKTLASRPVIPKSPRSRISKYANPAMPDQENPPQYPRSSYQAAFSNFYIARESAGPSSAAPHGHVESGFALDNQPAPVQMRYLGLLAGCFLAAAVIGAATGFYFVLRTAPPLTTHEQPPVAASATSPVRMPGSPEFMAMRIEEMRKIAIEDSDGPTDTGKLVGPAVTNQRPLTAPANQKDRPTPLPKGGGVETTPCSAASLALALCAPQPK